MTGCPHHRDRLWRRVADVVVRLVAWQVMRPVVEEQMVFGG